MVFGFLQELESKSQKVENIFFLNLKEEYFWSFDFSVFGGFIGNGCIFAVQSEIAGYQR